MGAGKFIANYERDFLDIPLDRIKLGSPAEKPRRMGDRAGYKEDFSGVSWYLLCADERGVSHVNR